MHIAPHVQLVHSKVGRASEFVSSNVDLLCASFSLVPEVSSHTATTSPSISGMATTSVASSSMSE